MTQIRLKKGRVKAHVRRTQGSTPVRVREHTRVDPTKRTRDLEKRWARDHFGQGGPMVSPWAGPRAQMTAPQIGREIPLLFDTEEPEKQVRVSTPGGEQPFLIKRFRTQSSPRKIGWIAYDVRGWPAMAITGTMRDEGFEVREVHMPADLLYGAHIRAKMVEAMLVDFGEMYSPRSLTPKDTEFWQGVADGNENIALDVVVGGGTMRFRLKHTQGRMFDVEQVATDSSEPAPQMALFSLGRLFKAATQRVGVWLRKSQVKAHTRRSGTVRAHVRRDKPKHTAKRVTPKDNVVYEYDEKTLKAARAEKFARVARLAQDLPEILGQVKVDLTLGDTPREKVVAAVVALIDRCKFRIGTEQMAEQHGTYGVTTLKPEHVTVKGKSIRFRFPGKKQVPWNKHIADADLAQFVASLKDGAEADGQLFWYNDNGTKKPLQATQVNKFLGKWGVSAKDLRTYHATRLVFQKLRKVSRPKGSRRLTKRETKARVKQVVEAVAKTLGHTPGVCKANYILPALIVEFERNAGRLTLPTWQEAS